jgi:hypothetical protein
MMALYRFVVGARAARFRSCIGGFAGRQLQNLEYPLPDYQPCPAATTLPLILAWMRRMPIIHHTPWPAPRRLPSPR